jgi:CO dehydrogenase nickel-insertion accessory protein CooC1
MKIAITGKGGVGKTALAAIKFSIRGEAYTSEVSHEI